MTEQPQTPEPSAPALDALESSRRDAELTDRIMSELEPDFGELRGYIEANHIAERVKLAITGARAA